MEEKKLLRLLQELKAIRFWDELYMLADTHDETDRYLSSPQFGQATQMLNNYLGSGGQSGGLNPLYQIGGPRSIQLALKLQF